jgi:hypothetical protein
VRRVVLLVVAIAIAGGLFALVPPVAPTLPAASPRLASPVRGAIHVHTRRSDGSGTIDDVAAAAARAGLQFVIVTDHGDGTRTPDPPVVRSNVLVIDAVEISTWGGHVIALALPKAPYPLAGEARDVIADIARLGAFSIIAHPVNDKPSARWTEWTAPFDGIEWLNLDSEWRDERIAALARVVLAYPFRRVESLGLLLDRSDSAMARWDVLTRRRRVVAVAGADAHARVGFNADEPYRRGVSIPVPTYEQLFRTFSIALPGVALRGNADTDAQAVIHAIRGGRVFSSVDALAARPAFSFTAASGAHRASGGDVLPVEGPVMLRIQVQAPGTARVVLFKDGASLREATGSSLEHDATGQLGVYRVEVMLPNAPGQPSVPWIVSNPIYVGFPATPPAVPGRGAAKESVPVYSDGAATGWTVEHSVTAQAAFDVVKSVGGTQLELRYALSGAASASPYAALVAAAGPALPQYDRVTFMARADRPMRVSVQLRVPGGGGGGERWQRSVYVDETPREITVFFDETTPVGATATRRPALERVQSVLFVIDTVNTPPGTAGRLFLDAIRYER